MKKPRPELDQKSAPPECTGTPAATLTPEVFQHAVEQADLAISITDTHANILYVNPAFSRVTGYQPDEVVGRNESLLSNKTTPPEVYKSLWQKIAVGEPWGGRLVNRRKDGGKYLAELVITPVADAGGEVVNYLGLHRDMTELHRLECQVRNQKALIESVVDGAPVALALIDGNEKIVLDNHEYKKLVADLGGREPASVILAAIRADLGADLTAHRSGEGYAFLDREVRIDRPNASTRWFSCSGVWVKEQDSRADSFFTDESRTYLLLVATEVTKLRAQQEKAQLAALQSLVAEEDRVNALRESLSAAVFQLEGPLNMISSAVTMLARRGSNDPMGVALAEAVALGEEALTKLRAMIPEERAENVTLVNVNDMVRKSLDLCTGRLLAAGISVAWKPQSTLPFFNGHANKLLTLFKSLMDNAIDAMNGRGWRERDLSVITLSHDNAIEVIVEDSGPGIPMEMQLKVFEPFFTTKDSARHIGTGLASAQQIAIDHGGSIEIDPETRKGCRIRVILPLQR
ncbi:MAG TPA: nitrogen fixation negative regulator NifL [Rhodocyclaceae bacterium]